jgi:4-amino-4-deoxy-L-arabinose transferase-like glycosyltransferase
MWLALFGVYAATLGIHAADHHRYAGDEPRYLLMARSIASDGDIDLRDEYARREYRTFYSGTLHTNGRVIAGRLVEPQPAGVSVLLAPAYALGGSVAAELLIAALAALAFVLAAVLARRLVPEPWATAAPLVCALSPPAIASATAIYPDIPAAAALTGAAVLALRYRDRPRLRTAVALGLVLAPVPWLGVKYLVPAVVVLLAAWRWAARRGRGTHGLVAAEVLFASLVAYVTVNGRLYEALTPYAVAPAGKPTADALNTAGLLDRLPRLASLWLDRGVGLLRWAPAFGLAFFAGWLLWRSRRDRVARAVPDQRDVEVTATLLLLLAGSIAAVAVVAAPTISGEWFPGRPLVAALPAAAALAAWGLRHAPRVGGALCALTVAAGAWLFVALRSGHGTWAHPPHEIPWGPLDAVFPRFGAGSAWAAIVGWTLAAGVAALVVRELLGVRRRQAAAPLSP